MKIGLYLYFQILPLDTSGQTVDCSNVSCCKSNSLVGVSSCLFVIKFVENFLEDLALETFALMGMCSLHDAITANPFIYHCNFWVIVCAYLLVWYRICSSHLAKQSTTTSTKRLPVVVMERGEMISSMTHSIGCQHAPAYEDYGLSLMRNFALHIYGSSCGVLSRSPSIQFQ